MKLVSYVILFLIQLVLGQLDVDSLMQLKKGIQKDPLMKVLVSWDSKSLLSDKCPKDWYGVSCFNGHITSITLNDLGLVGEFDFSAVSSLRMLQNLSIANNQFTGTVTEDVNFASLELLKYIDLHSNGFVGDVMGLLGQLGSVEYVDVSKNGFSGSMDLGVGNPDFMSSVRYLNVSGNNLTGELFRHDGLTFLDSLEVFDASDNGFTGNVPSFSFVVSLRVLKLGNNQLSGSLPQGLLQESSMVLSELDLSRNQLEGSIEVISSVNLRSLNLSSNRLSGPLPSRISHCAIIDLSNNMFTGNLSRIQNWGNYIEVIDLSSNQLTGPFPNQTSQLLRLTSLKISNNSLQGDLPPIIGTYSELETIDFSSNQLTGFLLPFIFNSSKFVYINLSSNKFSGNIPSDAIIQQNDKLLFLDLSHNALTGILPPELGRLKNIVYLDLSNNLLEGGIPNDLPETMVGFNVSYNNLSGVVPESLQRFPSSSFHPGNYLLVFMNESPSTKGGGNLSIRSHDSRTKSVVRVALIAGIAVGISIIAILMLVIHFRVRREGVQKTKNEAGLKKVSSPLRNESNEPPSFIPPPTKKPEAPEIQESVVKTEEGSSSPKIQYQSENLNALKVCSPDKMPGDLHLFDNSLKFTPEELSSAPAEAVGMSCHGTLYKAVLSSGYVLAVKLLKEGIAKGRKEFAREAKKLGNIRHPNLVSLQGYYWGPKEHEKLIISNYIDAPCLTLYLHGTSARTLPPLSVSSRLKIATDVARCLTYLHNESAIPHGNLKSTNILIQIPTMNALVTDYTLHRLLTSIGTAEQVLDAGALGYLPPEFATTSKPCPSLKSDVYAFGVVLLELLTGRSSADIVMGNAEVVDLTEWVKSMAAQNRAIECCDMTILGQSEGSISESLDSMLQIALKCVLPADERPDMRVVLEELSSIVL